MSRATLNEKPISDIITAARQPDLSIFERSALYAAATAYATELEEFIDDHYGPAAKEYERSQLASVISHLAIVLGFGVHPVDRPHEGVWIGIEQDWYKFVSNMNSAFAERG